MDQNGLPPNLETQFNQDEFVILNSPSLDLLNEDHKRLPLFFVQDDSFDEIDPNEADDPKLKTKSHQTLYSHKDINDELYQEVTMESKYFSLSSIGLTNVSRLPIVDDFTFVVGTKEYHCNKFLAAFMSPAITRLFLSDINANKFIINLNDKECIFESIMSLLRGDVIQITEKNIEFLMQVAKIFENDEMIEFFSAHIPSLHEGNVIDLYLQRLQYKLETSQEVEFIASNFQKIPFDSLMKLNPSQLAEIIGNESLRIKDENSFFQIIYEYIEKKGHDSIFLLGYINLPCLGEDFIPIYIQMITPDTINGMMWDSICERLKLEVKQKKKKKAKMEIDQEMEKERMFEGILNRMKTKSNIRKNVKITASSFKTDNMYILTDRSKEGYWSSYNLPGSWIKFYFKNKSIKLDEYSLETADLPSGKGHMISWVLEASNDDINWITLDTQYNYNLHEGYMAAANFPCDKSGFYRYFRIKQCGLNDMGDDTMILKAVEFFGRVKSIT